ncbi:MAG: helix-turn-helix domain-containing protein [Thermomicrobiales bacterium]
MREVLYIDDVERAGALLKPLRVELLRRMTEPRTCPELGEELGETPQKIYYHVKVLEKAGLVEKVAERRMGGINEGQYQASARSYWMSPQLVGQVGDAGTARDQLSLGYILGIAEQLQSDIGQLSRRVGEDTPSLGLSAEIYLEDGQRRADFLNEVRDAVQGIAEKYGQVTGIECDPQSYRLMIACYPAPDDARGERGDDEPRRR